MQDNSDAYKLLRLKIASEFVLSSQAAVAFSRVFYLEEVVVDKISKEHQELKQRINSRLEVAGNFLKTVDLEDDVIAQCNIRVVCTNIQNELNKTLDEFERFQRKISAAAARRKAKSSLLQNLSATELMSKFECMSVTELREIQVPEYSCFINESDFGLLERLNEDWNKFRKEVYTLIDTSASQLDLLKVQDHSSSYREIHGCSYPGLENSKVSQSQFKDFSEPSSNHPPPPLDEIGKTFANRSGSVMRKFSTLLRRGKRTSKTLSASFLESSSDA